MRTDGTQDSGLRTQRALRRLFLSSAFCVLSWPHKVWGNAPPGNPTIGAVNVSSINVVWVATNSVNGYELDAATGPFVSTPTVISSITANVNATGLYAVGLSPNTTYFLQAGTLYPGSTLYAVTNPTATVTLANPLSGAQLIQTGSNTITAGWIAVSSGAAGYLLDVSTTSTFTSGIISTGTFNLTQSTLTVGGLASGTTYFVRAGAQNWGGVANYVFLGSTMTTPGFSPPINPVIGSVFVTSMTITWGPVSSSNGYLVEASTAPTFTGTITSTSTPNGNAASLIFNPSLFPNTTYFVHVGALWGGTTSFANTTPQALSTLTNPVASIQLYQVVSTSFTVNWTAMGSGSGPNTALGYMVQASSNNNMSPPIYSSTTNNVALSTLTVTGLSASTTYYFGVAAVNWNGVPNFVFAGSTMTTAGAGLPAPTGLVGNATSPTSINWSWNLVGGATGYNIYQATSPTTLVGSTTTTAFTENGLAVNTAYGRFVQALGPGQQSPLSASATFFTLTNLPGAPSTSNVGSSSFTVTWGTAGNPGYTPYEVSLALNNGFTVGVTTPVPFAANLTANTTAVIGLNPGTPYWVRVRASNGNGVPSGPSLIASTTTMSGSSVSGSGVGTASLAPGSIPEGGIVTSTLTYTVPSGGMVIGGRLEVDLPPGWWPNPQNASSASDDYVTVSSTATATLNLALSSTSPVILVNVQAGVLPAGTQIKVALQNIHPNCPAPTQTQVAWAVKSAMSVADPLGSLSSQPTQTFVTGQAQWVGYNPWNTLTAIVNQASQAIVLQTNDSCGVPVPVSSPLIVNLQGYLAGGTAIDPGALFSTVSNFSSSTTSVIIPAASSSTIYYYKTSSSGNNLQILGNYTSPVSGLNQQVWRSVNVLTSAPSFSNVAVDNGTPVAGQTSMTLSPDGSGVNNFAYIRFAPSDTTTQWHVTISSSGFQTIVFERWGSGNPQGTVSWDGRNYNANGNPQVVPNGTYTVKVEFVGVTANTSLSISVNSAQISGNVTVGGSPAAGAQVNAQGANAPGYSFATTDANGNYTLYGLHSGSQYNLYVSYVNPANQAVATGQASNVTAGAASNFALTTPATIRVSAVIASSVSFPVFGAVNAHSVDYSQNYWGSVRLLAGTTTSDNGDPFNPSSWTVLYVQPGSYVLHFQIPGLGANDVTVTAPADVVINLQKKASVYGLITLPAVATNNIWVSVEGVLQGNNFPTVWGGASFSVGQSSAVYAVYAVDPGAYTFRARPDGYIPQSVTATVTSADIGDPQTGGLNFSGFSTGGKIAGTITVNGDTTSQQNPFTLWISAYSPTLGTDVFTQVQLATNGTSTNMSYQLKGVADGTYQVFPPYLTGFEGNPPGPQTVVVAGGNGSLNLTLNQVTGRVRGAITLPVGQSDYTNVHLSLQGPYQQEVDLSAASYSLNNLGTGQYSLVATYKTTGAQTRSFFTLANGQTMTLNLDLSAATYSVSGSVSVQSAFTMRNSTNTLVTINTLSDLLNNATTQTLILGGIQQPNPPSCAGGTPITTTTVRVEAFPKNFNSFNSADRSNFNNCFGVGQYKYGVVNANGNYTISGLFPGVWDINVYPYFDNGRTPNAAAAVQTITVVSGNVSNVNFPLSNGHAVSGTIGLPAGVIDTRSFNALVLGPRGDLVQSTLLMITGANTVSYQFTGLPSGSYAILIQDPGTFDPVLQRNVIKYVAKPAQFTMAGADVTGTNVTMSRASSIVGKFLIQGSNPDGTPALTLITTNNQNLLPSNFHISAQANPWVPGGDGAAQSGVNGGVFIDNNNQFHIDGLVAATYDVNFRQDSFGLAIQGAGSLNIASLTKGSIKVTDSQTIDLGTITLVPGISLTGTVKDTSGNALANIPVEARAANNQHGSNDIRVFTDAQGNFTLAGLDPGVKNYNVTVARRPGPGDTSQQPVPYGTASKLAVDVTQVPLPTLNFSLPPANAQLTGKIVTVDGGSLAFPESDQAGFPVAAIYTRIQGSVDTDNPLGDVSATALDGTFTIPYLPAGIYDITIESLGYRPLKVTGVTLTSVSKDLGTLTLQKGPTLTTTLAKPDGSNVNTNDVQFAVAVTADLGSIIFGRIVSDANTNNITSIQFSGFELAPKTYNILLFDKRDNITTPPEGKALSFSANTDSVTKALTFQPSAPFAFAHVVKSGASVVVTYYFSRPLRNRGDDQTPATWFATSAHPERLSGYAVSADRRHLTVLYAPVAGEQNATIQFSAHTVDVDPSTGVEFAIVKTVTLLLGQKATSENNINPALGGSVSLADSSDPSHVSVPSNALLGSNGSSADASSSYAITFTATDDAGSIASAAHGASAAQALAPVLARGPQAYVSEAYQAMQKLASGTVTGRASSNLNPLSSFYSVLLPAGLSHTLNQNAALTLNYSSNADPTQINVYFFNGTEYLIEQNNRVIDAVNHTISVSVSHFSTFVVLQNSAQVVVVNGDATSAADIDVMNFPNPFDLQTKTKTLNHGGTTSSLTTDGTIIRYQIPAAMVGPAKIDIYDVVGEKVRSMDLGVPTGGTFQYVAWDGKNDSGNKVASGVYIGVLKVGGAKKFWKMAVIK